MGDDFEDRLRDRLHDATGDVRREGDAWSDMRRRARRQDVVARVGVGATALALVAVVAALPGLLDRRTVEFEPFNPGPTTEPAPAVTEPAATEPGQPTSTGDATPGTGPGIVGTPAPAGIVDAYPAAAAACGGPAAMAVVYATLEGELAAVCQSGAGVLLTDATAQATNPAVSPDGTAVVYETAAVGPASLVLLDLTSGEQTLLRAGALPAFAPNGTLAWTVGGPGADGRLQAGPVLGAATFDAPAVTPAPTSLAWDADSRHLYYTDAYAGGGEVNIADTDAATSGARDALDAPEGGRYLAVTGTPASGAAGFVLDRGDGAGAELVERIGLLGVGSVTDTFPRADLGDLLSGELRSGRPPLRLDYAGPVALDRAADDGEDGVGWVPSDADGPSWLLSDGTAAYLIAYDGSATLVSDGVQSAVIHPAVQDMAATAFGDHEVAVFFGVQDSVDCAEVAATTRTVEGPQVLRGAINALIAGPTQQERERGATSFFSEQTAGLLVGVRLEAGVAQLDFDPAFTQVNGMSTSCGAMSVIAQLDATAMQFPSVDDVVYSLGGDVDAFYESLQLAAPG